ncbi:MAG: YcaO-like family protein, partial [Promethearchaeota archaeon]
MEQKFENLNVEGLYKDVFIDSSKSHNSPEDLYFSQILRGGYKELKPKILRKEPLFSQFKSKKKQAKDKSFNPSETIEWFISVLENHFWKTPFKMAHVSFMNSPGTWSVFCGVYNKYWEIFSSYGKGLTLELAMASAYGELIERIQGGYFFSKNPYKPMLIHNYLTSKEIEKKADSKDILKLNDQFKQYLRKNCTTPHIIDTEYHNNLRKFFVYHEFNDLINNKRIWLQRSLYQITTGYSTGNSYEEAFVQAFSEIIERYSVFKILSEKIKIPTVSKDILPQNLQNIIAKIEENNIEVIVKDASLDHGFPTAIVLCDFKKVPSKMTVSAFLQKYIISPGSASSFNIAIERALTEMHQSVKNLLNRNLEATKQIQKIERLYQSF